MTNNEELSNALVDVRKAYRLLYLFQRRILDLVDQLSGKLELKFWYWWPSGNELAIRAADDPCGRDAWKMLPLFDARFFYLPRGVNVPDSPQKRQWFLGLLLSPDDGHSEGGRGEADPAKFADPAQCRSRIYLYAFIVLNNVQGNWDTIYNAHKNSKWPKEGPAVDANDEVRVVCLSSDLASLADASDVDSFAIRFRELVEKEGGEVV